MEICTLYIYNFLIHFFKQLTNPQKGCTHIRPHPQLQIFKISRLVVMMRAAQT